MNKIIEEQYKSKHIFEVKQGHRKEYFNRFKSLTDKRKKKIKIIKGGHIKYGWHKVCFAPHRAKYFTFIRNPLSRTLSFYKYAKKSKNHYLFSYLNSGVTLEDFLLNSDYNHEISNGQTKMLYGLRQREIISKFHLDEVKKRILSGDFIMIGLTDFYEESLFLLSKVLNWEKKIINYKLNITSEANSFSEKISTETTNIIKKNNELDFELYHFTKEIFEQKISMYSIEEVKDFIEKVNKK